MTVRSRAAETAMRLLRVSSFPARRALLTTIVVGGSGGGGEERGVEHGGVARKMRSGKGMDPAWRALAATLVRLVDSVASRFRLSLSPLDRNPKNLLISLSLSLSLSRSWNKDASMMQGTMEPPPSNGESGNRPRARADRIARNVS